MANPDQPARTLGWQSVGPHDGRTHSSGRINLPMPNHKKQELPGPALSLELYGDARLAYHRMMQACANKNRAREQWGESASQDCSLLSATMEFYRLMGSPK